MFKRAAALLICLAGLGCGHPVQDTAAHKIADALPSLLGPAAHYDVQVDGDPLALTRGRARTVHIQGQDVQVSPALTLDTLEITAEAVSLDTQARRLDHVGRTRFTATLTQAHLAAYLAQSKPRLPGLTVTLRAGDVEARVPIKAFGLHTVARLTGSLAPDGDDPRSLDFVTNGAHFGAVPLPTSLINLALEALNPVVKLPGLKAPLTITDASVKNSRLYLQGTADLNGLVHR